MDLLETPALLLRPLCAADEGFVVSLLGCPLVRRYLGGPVREAERAGAFARYLGAGPEERVWLVRAREGAQPLGLVFLGRYREGDDLELSYQFDASVWGRGHASAAVRAVAGYAAHALGRERWVAETQSANTASCRLLERAGMTEQRRLMRFGAEQVVYAGAV